MVSPIPEAEWPVSAALVTALLAEQAPALADLPLRPVTHGWDNVVFRLGDDLAVRVPRRSSAVPLIHSEIVWLPRLAPALPTRTPEPVVSGVPSPRFEHPWSVVRWIDGTPAAASSPAQRRPAAAALADVLVALHRPAHPDAPANPWRGVPLDHLAARVEARTGAHPDGVALLQRWRAWSSVPSHAGPPVWLHGDLHPLNVVVDANGALAGVLDWGDLCAGDPATDLAAGWLLFDAPGRRAFRDRCDDSGSLDQATWTRAKAWALHLGLIFASAADDQPLLHAAGRHALEQVLAEAD